MYNAIRNRRVRKVKKEVDIQLTAMMDVMIIILVFLLKSYQTSINSFTSVSNIRIPYSYAQDTPLDSIHVIITPDALTFEDERIVEFLDAVNPDGTFSESYRFKPEDLDEGNLRIIPLYIALVKSKEKSLLLRSQSKARDEEGKILDFDGILSIQADEKIRYQTLRKVMYTAAAAGFKVYRLLAKKRET